MAWTNAGRKKASASRKGHRLSAATKKKISNALKGKKHPHKGHPESAATRAKISKALKGKKHPHKGHPMSAATRAKISAALRGRHHSHKGHPRARKPMMTRISMRLGVSNAQILHLTRSRLLNATVLDRKEHRNINSSRIGSNRRVVTNREHRKRRRA